MLFDKFKEVNIKGRKFVVKKFDARTGSYMLIKVIGILTPMIKALDFKKLKKFKDMEIEDDQNFDISSLDIASIASGLTGLSEDDFNFVHDKCLQVCYENLPSGPAQVLTKEGTFGVIGLEDDSATTMALVAHTLIFNVTGFFGESPLSSVLGGLMSSK